MSRTMVLLVVLAQAIPGLLEEGNLAAGTVRKMLPTVERSAADEGTRPCGKYFKYLPPDPPSSRTYMILRYENKTPTGNPRFMTLVAENIRTVHFRKVAGPKVPTVTMVNPDRRKFPWIEIQVNDEDFRASPCLAQTKVVTK